MNVGKKNESSGEDQSNSCEVTGKPIGAADMAVFAREFIPI